MSYKFAAIATACLLILAGAVTYRAMSFGSSENDYEVICLGGHEYWHANFAATGLLAGKLSEDGKPVSCK